MTKEAYEKLAEALNRLPNGFPRTESGIEILILRKIFTEAEASLAGNLGKDYESHLQIADRVGLPIEEVKHQLELMSRKGLLWSIKVDADNQYRLAPWIVGIYEAQLDDMDHEFAHLVEEYFDEGGIEGVMRPQPPIHRVIPSHGAVKTEWILPYDDVKAVIEAQKTFSVRNCICRVQQNYLGRKCDFPINNCLSFSVRERPPRRGDISKEEALALLDEAEDQGLVHTVSNVIEGFGYICNCCGCCCGILRGITEYGVENSVAHANYYSEIDLSSCMGCGLCVERCQVNAISLEEGVAKVDVKRCIGCGLCVTKCPTDAAKLMRKPDDKVVTPPIDFTAWENDRLRSRGLAK